MSMSVVAVNSALRVHSTFFQDFSVDLGAPVRVASFCTDILRNPGKHVWPGNAEVIISIIQ